MTLTARHGLAFIVVALAALALAALGLSLTGTPVGADGDHNQEGLHHDHFKPAAGYKFELDVAAHNNLDTEEQRHHHHGANVNENYAAHTMVNDPVYEHPTPEISPDEDFESTLLIIPVEVDFGVNMTGFTAGDITLRGVGNLTISNFATGSTGLYTFDITTERDGPIYIIVPAKVAQTDVGVGNRAITRTISVKTSTATELDVIIRAVVRPALDEINVFIRFTDSVDDFLLSDITRSGVSGLDYDLTGSGNEYVLEIMVTGTQSGTLNVRVPANVATNANGVGNTASDPEAIPIDIVAPTVSSITLRSQPNNNNELRFVFSEPVTDFVEDDITQSGLGRFNITGMSRSFDSAGLATTFTAYIQVTRAGSVTVGVPEGAVRDRAWHTNVDAFTEDLTVMVGGM